MFDSEFDELEVFIAGFYDYKGDSLEKFSEIISYNSDFHVLEIT
jgi:hypothetical protein